MARKLVLLFGLSAGLSAGCFLKKAPPPKAAGAQANQDGPATVLECMDRCKPDGVHLYQPCYDACTRYVDAKTEFEDAEGDWLIQKDAVPAE